MGLRIAAESCRGNQKTWVPTDLSPWAEGPRNKSGHGGPSFVQSSAALSFGGNEKRTRAGMDEIGLPRAHYLIASEHQLPSRCSSNSICYRLLAARRTWRWAGSMGRWRWEPAGVRELAEPWWRALSTRAPVSGFWTASPTEPRGCGRSLATR